MKKKPAKFDIGVIVGRFQVDSLHEMHIELIDKVCKLHGKVGVFLGVTPVLGSSRNPLDYPTREAMIRAKYPTIVVAPIPDRSSDEVWSAELDARIRELFPIGSVCLYGGRDSFLRHYAGKFSTSEIDPGRYVSGTDVRKRISNQVMASPEFRAGVIYSTFAQYPRAYPTVDIAVLRLVNGKPEVLLARKPNETLHRFVGGFVDPSDDSLEKAALRELAEEAGVNLEVSDMEYVASMLVQDWRYAGETSKIVTSLFATTHLYGMPQPSDDIEELEWFSLAINLQERVVSTHKPLAQKLLNRIQHGTVNNQTFIACEV